MDTTKIPAALDTLFDSMDLGSVTVRDYLKDLLLTLLEQGESFSGKRPWGNSGWERELAGPLIRAGVITGELDEDGRAEWNTFDGDDYEMALAALVDAL